MSEASLKEVVLQDGDVRVSILNYGAITREWLVPLKGKQVPVVLGFESAEAYLQDTKSTGVIAGRVANRIANGRFEMGGKTYQLNRNEGENTLHGGHSGLGRRFWEIEPDGARRVRLSYHSPAGEEGFPGAVDFSVEISLAGSKLTYEMRAKPSEPTPVNLAQHNYYSLGEGLVWGQRLRLNADRYTPTDTANIPTGEVLPVSNTALDFREGRVLSAADHAIDNNLMPSANRDPQAPVAELSSPGGLRLQMWSDQPCVQIYASAKLPAPHTGFCLEPQYPPDAMNHANFPSIIATPEQPYRQVLAVDISEVRR